MTILEFEQQRETRSCRHCGTVGMVTERNPNNNGLQIVCPSCHSATPWAGVVFLRQSIRKRREPQPHGKTLDDVWLRYGDHCVSCGQSREALDRLGIGRHAHHVLPYARHGHTGPVVPVCTICHDQINALQRIMARFMAIMAVADVPEADDVKDAPRPSVPGHSLPFTDP